MSTSQPSQKKRRILTISKPYVSQAYRDKLLSWQMRGEFDIGLICPPSWDGQRFEESPDDKDIWVQKVPIWADGHNHFHIYKKLGHWIRAFRPDLLHIEEEHYSLVTWQALRHAKRLGIPATFYTWQNIDKDYPAPFSWIEKDVFRHAYAISGNQEAKDILQRKGYRGDIAVIPQMGVDLARFPTSPDLDAAKAQAKQHQQWDAKDLWLGYLGRLVPEKGMSLILEVMASLPSSFRLYILGDGPERQNLLDQIQALSLQDRVIIQNRIPSAQVPQVLLALDALVLPSLTTKGWKEQFGRVLIEAMAAKTAVIGSSSGEIPHVVADAGWIAAEGQRDAWQKTLAGLTHDTCRQAGERGRRRVEARFTNQVVADAFHDLFYKILSKAQ